MRAPILALALAASPAAAQDTDLELVLLADASGSITPSEIAFQRQGYAEALTDPDVIAAIRSTAYGSIAVTYVEWAANQAVVVDWQIVEDAESAAAFAGKLLDPPRQAYGRNAIGAALLEGKRLMETNAIEGWRRVIDFSGDSANSYSGPSIEAARAEVLAAGIVINALPILSEGRRAGIEEAYRDRIAGGPGSFVVTASDRASFAEALTRKLVLEISDATPR